MKKYALLFLCLLILIVPSQAFAERKVPILIYHSIDEFTGHGSKELYVTPKNFEEQMIYLRDHGYTLLTFERWQDIDKVNKPIFITFDDGYKNNLNVFTTFQKLKTDQFHPSGTFFVISDFIGRSNRLSKSDLKMLAISGLISIQSHTATHPDLTKIKNYEYELKESSDKIQQITGKPVIALAYPYGKYNDKVIAETKKSYQFGLTTIPEPFYEKGTKNERYLLPRIYVKYSTTIEEFAKIVDGL
ncbi:polysaccharide deacetylase family protein [Lederbergia citrea]|uniref:Polysaccharide deacetylase family protein n=1 Tax=Lederbergia citrea TaxID=2833581 RepID=A0A942Z317_9BACI|nr:polysaccharide deacetylase family protein [Lederbergia citrea]MBS4176709.1 polysaccharide deacetylase family protein [Lederbergia citrea]MBS4203270.1 polysaccharide deacetylase family protein [Lederbergia citrea]MBS4222059.1 polysaccharide deacetylase family protein [Lederbergia citrea]